MRGNNGGCGRAIPAPIAPVPPTCTDIDECASNNGGCDPVSACTNTDGGFSCGECPAGYSGTGDTGCVDIDECASNNGGCSVDEACVNNVGAAVTCLSLLPVTFEYTGEIVTYTVPPNVNRIRIEAKGASGGTAENWDAGTSVGGFGGQVTAEVLVTALEPLIILVGAAPDGVSTRNGEGGGFAECGGSAGGGGGTFIGEVATTPQRPSQMF